MLGNSCEINSFELNINKINIRCYTAGETGLPVILLHGAGVDSADISWSEVIGPLSETHRVFAPDLPGYGASDKPEIEYSLPFYMDFLKQFMVTLNLDQASLIGLSLGGGISFGFALEYPLQVDNLILVDAWGLFRILPYHRLSYWYTKSFFNELSYKWSGKSRRFVKWTLLNRLFGNPDNLSEELVDEVYEILKAPDAGKAFISFQRSEITKTGLRTNLAGRFAELKIPTLIVHGTDDTSVPVRYAKDAHKNIQGSEIYLMEGCKHWPQKERPEEFTEAITKFLLK
ncbi:alpha/beta fold hydrolase [Virgibacillus oceani]|uniref:Alpha/beta hydrolase n=1 Tax=Virgibacillus oceani TaxID=1479511 RepID=A0A917HG84_9BACI|nr:alpha/beta hydrolase [Virgibacillus oceani]GGG78684.1 alpha/beta hydrolase [Virgibacillus oceani]